MGSKKAFWTAVLVDGILLMVAVILGWLVFRLLNPDRPAAVISPTQTIRVYQPLKIDINVPDGIVPNKEYILEVIIQNPDSDPVTIKQIVLPFGLMDNSVIINSDPPIGDRFSGDDGAGYMVNVRIDPAKQQKVSITLRAKKMQAISGKLILYTDHARQEKDFVVVIAPVPDTPTPTKVTPTTTPIPTKTTPIP